ncbi:helix-turn-helix domain containing protein [Amycolatopsis sp. 195334CR]|uniref:helix-turn-helix domain containing protein n=1 Tax=Amycolatopsis sp. 195334CR TaxID=2814588 RepID=UPI001A8CBC32|nr:helix-turn-helix domain containing protein [Amycolatopsis sp. 195334CR]MBN6038660.1 helix-turn-helix domain containing protein [Amycolatopsis sp. 195334CR]
MTVSEQHRTEIRTETATYTVEATSLPEARVAVDVSAAGPQGEPVADGHLELDAAAAATLANVLAKALRSAGALGRTGARRPGPRPAHQGQPWSPTLDEDLERRWLAGEPVEAIAEAFGRSPGSIRARLPRVGCDPEAPGAYLPDPPSRREVTAMNP